MKILLLIFVANLYSCVPWKESDHTSTPNGPYEPPLRTDTYVGIAIVKMECGVLCKNPMIRAFSEYDPYICDFFADTAGNIYVEIGVEHAGELGEFEWFEVQAFMNADSTDLIRHAQLIHYPHMLFKDIDVEDQDIPVTEVIFPDYLAGN